MYTKSSYPLLVVVVIAMALCLLSEKLSAQIDPTSLCAHRPNVVFSSGVEDLSQINPLGLQDCGSLVNYIDDDLIDSNPLVVSLEGDQSYDFATLRSLSSESTQGAYTVSGSLPEWVVFDSEFGVSSLSPSCADQGSHLVEYNVAPGEGPGSINPLFVQYEVSCPSTLSVEGLDFECDGSLTQWPYHGNWFDANNDGEIDQPWFVYENKFDPAPACVMTDKPSISLSTRGDYVLPEYAALIGGRIEMHPDDETAGQSGTLELLITDTATGSTRPLDVPYEVVPKQPTIVGLSYTEQNGTIDNPVLGSRFQFDVDVPCTADDDRRWIVTQHYDPDMSYQEINLPTDIMGLNQSTGSIFANPSCPGDIGRDESISVRAQNTSAASLYKTADYVFTNGVGQQSAPLKTPNYR